MRQYIDIVKNVLEHGKEKRPVRKNSEGKFVPVDGGVITIALPNILFSHNMSDGFPLLTTKKMAWKAIRVELEGFVNGVTDKKWYQDRGCKIWNEWANPQIIQQKIKNGEYSLTDAHNVMKQLQAECDDLGPIYGYQWRRFGEHYSKSSLNGVFQGVDQLASIVDTLRNNPMDRRMVCLAWNPNQLDMMALPPCHYAWNVTVIGDELHLFWAQRSCDLMLGVPFNIASYGLLLELLAKDAGLKPGNLSGMLVDCHIYENQIEAAKEQITRNPKPLPNITIQPDKNFDIFKWTHEQVSLNNYNSYDKIDFGAVVV